MVVAISYLLAVVITVLLAIVLYPIAGIFWILGFFGRLSEGMFAFTQRAISSLWKDIKKANKSAQNEIIGVQLETANESWKCSCGANNQGRYCSACGSPKI